MLGRSSRKRDYIKGAVLLQSSNQTEVKMNDPQSVLETREIDDRDDGAKNLRGILGVYKAANAMDQMRLADQLSQLKHPWKLNEMDLFEMKDIEML